jgi:hypothetical protein
MAREPKPKPVNYTRINPDEDAERIHPLIAELVKDHHSHLSAARIGAAWRRKLKRDKDGLLVLGKCKKASDCDREFHDLDFVIILNQEAWSMLNDAQRRALVDHELMHANVARDKYGSPKEDVNGRAVYRVRKHDVEEFRDIITRHGCYKADLEAFVRAAMDSPKPPGPTLFDETRDEGGSLAERVMDHIEENASKIEKELQNKIGGDVTVKITSGRVGKNGSHKVAAKKRKRA